MNVKTLVVLSTLALSTASFAHESVRNNRLEYNQKFSQELKNKIRNLRARPDLVAKLRNLFKPKNLTTVACGDIITSSITIANDLNCPDVTGYALQVVGSNITVNANGKKIVAPNATAGLYVEGKDNTIANFDIQGVTNGYGMMAYNTSELKVISNNFSRNKIGIMLYADEVVRNPIVMSNKASANSFAGVEMIADDAELIQNPIISYNDFKLSGEFAIYLKADNVVLNNSRNEISGSTNGFYLTGGDYRIKNLELTSQLIQKRHFTVDSVSSILFQNVELNSIAPATTNQDRVAIDMYKVEKFELDNVALRNTDTGLKIATDSGVATTGLVKNTLFQGQTFAGLYIVSWDDTALGTIKVQNLEFKNTANGILMREGTLVNLIQK